ncbi:MAG: RusA family crossover junction endodeoxyribonuclease, partial [Elusimicrobiota bacterium]
NSVGMALRLWAKSVKLRPIDSYCGVDLWFILPRTNCDAHNYGKVLFDAMEAGGLVTNDKYILPRVMGVWHARESEVIVKIPDGQDARKVNRFMDTGRRPGV